MTQEYIEQCLAQHVCPECGSTKTEDLVEPMGEDNYELTFYCTDCGFTATA